LTIPPKILLDTNVVLDVLLDRQPFAEPAAVIFALAEEARIRAWLCATTITTIDYLLGKSLSRTASRDTLRKLLGLFEIAPVNRSVIEDALKSRITDFEDAVLEASGRLAGAEIVVTRNARDFRYAVSKVLDPQELLVSLR
jgi:predicted nucleic acid-binding protein